MVGSPTVFANAEVEHAVREAARGSHAAFIPSGALWGAQDIQKMAELGTLRGLTITMKKHPSSLKVVEELQPALREVRLHLSVSHILPLSLPDFQSQATHRLLVHRRRRRASLQARWWCSRVPCAECVPSRPTT